MPTTQDAINRMSIQATTVGVDESTEKLKQLAAAQGGVAVASQSTERATLSLDKSFSNLERRFNNAVRNQQDYEKIQKQVNLAVAQNPALQERANAVMAAAAERYGQISGAQKALGIATQTANLQIAAFASGLGLTGQILSAFGPAGFAAAVALGAVESALSLASQKSHELAQKSKEIFEFSEATGLTTRQFQALRSEAGKFGVDAETLASGLAKFSVGFEELRQGSGALLQQINRINPAIAEQMKTTTDAATAFTLFGKAVADTDNIFQRNALLKAGLGRGAATYGGFLGSAPDVVALGKAAEAAGRGIDENLINKLRQLEIDINKTKAAANTVFATMFGSSTLQAELDFQKGMLSIAQTLKSMTMSEDLKKFIDFLANPAMQGLLLGVIAGGGAGAFLGGVGAVPGAILGGGAGFLAGAVKSRVTDIGATSGTSILPVPDAPNFDATFKTFDKQKLDDAKKSLALLATEAKNLVAVLGSAASPADKLNASILELQSRAKDAGVSADVLARGIGGLKLDAAIAQQNAHNSALGASTPIIDLVRAKTLQLLRAQQDGANLTPAQIAFQKQLTAAQALGTFQLDAAIDGEKLRIASMGMSTEAAIAYNIVQSRINLGIQNGNPLNAAEIQQLQQKADAYARLKVEADRYQEVADLARASAGSFANDLINGLREGKTLMQSLGAAALNLSKSLQQGAITSLFKGDFLMAGIQGVASVFAGVFGQRQAEAEAAEKAAADALDRISSYQDRAQAAVIDTQTLNGQLIQFDREADRQRLDEFKKGSQGMVALEAALAAERQAIVNKAVKDSQQAFDALIQKAKSATQTAVATLTDATSNLAAALTALGKGIDGLSGGVSTAIGRLQADFVTGLMDKLNAASGLDYVASVAALVTQRHSDLADAATLGINSALVEQSFQAQVQKVIDGAELTGVAFQQMLTVFPQLTGRVHEFSGVAMASVSALSSFISKIEEFRKGLLINSSLSTLSPTDRYAEARRQYEETLAGARAGDATAQSGLQAAVTAFLTESKSYNASNVQYALDFASTQDALVGVQTAAQSQINIAQQQLAQLIQLNSNVIAFTLAASSGGAISSTVGTAAGNTQAAASVNAAAAAAQAAAEAAKTWHYPLFNPYTGIGAKGEWSDGDYARFRAENPGARYQMGGLVTNGIYNQDSVTATVAGGEFIVRAPMVTPQSMPMLQAINSGRSAVSNDNGVDQREIARALAKSSAADADRIIAKLDQLLGALDGAPAKTKDALRQLVASSKQRATG